jgi:hypothetical protein
MLYIHHANTGDVLHVLAEATLSHRVVPFYGCKGSGKSWLLGYLSSDYWRQERSMKGNVPRIAYVELWEPTTKSGRLATPPALVAFSEITLGLAQISRRHDSEFTHNSRLWYRQGRRGSEDKLFATLYPFVRDEVRRLTVDGLLIDNAHYLDRFTLQKLKAVRRFRNDELALLLCAPIEEQGHINESVARLMGTVFDELEVEQKVELKRMTDREAMGKVFLELLAHHNARFSPEVPVTEIARMRRMFWDETQGDWTSIAVRSRRLKDFLGPYKGQVRLITRDLWEKVMGKPLPEYGPE